ncbi:endonuclease/exonuclease/phosphatase family protein [Miltoncostaea marina]|uniref:endonuclease/exonuclease/phosphatase family protein n=1 Tax=Miltoncostaea marina TaxID=2843215 RepID=UPI001C3D44ED|nr:endonuclease/exonuclease/phosphatase family protein [Miltoncostaea marina]
MPPPTATAERPPREVTRSLARLRAALDDAIPAKRDGENLLVGTWNLREFGRVTPKWAPGPEDSPRRCLSDILAIAAVAERFDVLAIQETTRSLDALRMLVSRLGRRWGFIVSDVSEGTDGNDERLAFVYDGARVRPSGLVGEFVMPDDRLGVIGGGLRRQLARTPYAVSFRAGEHGFTLATVHILWGDAAADRTPEIAAFAEFLAEEAREPDAFSRNMIVLGDFNIDRWDDANWRAFVSRGLSPPEALLDLPRTIFAGGGGTHSFYDQIAWFTLGAREALTLPFVAAGSFPWDDHVLVGLSNVSKSWRISDHFPLWSEFALPTAGG